MTHRDRQLRLADAYPLTSSALSEHILDLGAVMDIANGQQLFAVFTVTTAFTGGGAEGMYFRVMVNGDLTPDIATSYAQPLLGQSSLIAIANLTAGHQVVVALSPITTNSGLGFEFTSTTLGRQYVYAGVFAVGQGDGVTADPFTGGAYDLELTPVNPRGQKFYPKAVSFG